MGRPDVPHRLDRSAFRATHPSDLSARHRLTTDDPRYYPGGTAGVSARQVRLRSRISVRVVEAGPATGTPLVLLPGWGGSAYLFSRNLPALAAAGLRAVVIEVQGQGGSDKPGDPRWYTLGALVDGIVETIDALALDRVALLGQSFGGRLALELALERPALVSKLALIDPVGLGAVSFDALLRLMTAILPAAFAPALTNRLAFSLTLRYATAAMRAPAREDLDQFAAPATDPQFARALFSTLKQMDRAPIEQTRLARLAMPVLVLCGERDRIVRCDQHDRELVLIPEAGHLSNFEAPDRVNAELLRFFAG